MKLAITAKPLLAATMLLSATQTSWASPEHRYFACVAKVIYSEELPFAPIGSWLVRATLEITPPHGSPYLATLKEWMPWQGPPPRRGQIIRVQCDPAYPGNSPLFPRSLTPGAF